MLLSVLACLGAGRAAAQPVSGSDLARELTGNTLSGYNGSLWFSEFHGPDGRIFGHNGGQAAEDACWRVRGDTVCYYYPGTREDGKPIRSEYCWRFERAGASGYAIALVGRSEGGTARLETGNPRNHSDGGRPWVCEALISRAAPPPPGRLLARLALRPPQVRPPL